MVTELGIPKEQILKEVEKKVTEYKEKCGDIIFRKSVIYCS